MSTVNDIYTSLPQEQKEALLALIRKQEKEMIDLKRSEELKKKEEAKAKEDAIRQEIKDFATKHGVPISSNITRLGLQESKTGDKVTSRKVYVNFEIGDRTASLSISVKSKDLTPEQLEQKIEETKVELLNLVSKF